MRSLGDILDQEAVGARSPTPMQRRLLAANCAIREEPPHRIAFLHSVFCQVGLPRRATDERVFERRSGHVSVRIEAGQSSLGSDIEERQLPYGALSRLILIHLSTEAVRKRSRRMNFDSARHLLTTLGLQTSGGARGGYRNLQGQMEALSACRMSLEFQMNGIRALVECELIDLVDAPWISPLPSSPSRRLVLQLSEPFYASLIERAVPVDPRAITAIRHSALAIDVYTWLAHRLCRVKTPQGSKISWNNLRDQFGQEYRNSRDFKREMRRAVRQAVVVYPDARVAEVIGGLVLYQSPPPVPSRDSHR